MNCSSVEFTKTTMKTVKIIDGKAMLCESIEANFQGEVKYKETRWYTSMLHDVVSRRMKKCMDQLTEAISKQQVASVDIVDMGGSEAQFIRYATGGGFVTSSYEVLDALRAKLAMWLESHRETVSYETLLSELTHLEADQLFKSYISVRGWCDKAAMLDCLRGELHRTYTETLQ